MIKSIVKLTKQVVASLAIQLRHGTENSFVMGEVDKVGLIPFLDWTPARGSLGLGLNFNELRLCKSIRVSEERQSQFIFSSLINEVSI